MEKVVIKIRFDKSKDVMAFKIKKNFKDSVDSNLRMSSILDLIREEFKSKVNKSQNG